jgi:hypothetical protein
VYYQLNIKEHSPWIEYELGGEELSDYVASLLNNHEIPPMSHGPMFSFRSRGKVRLLIKPRGLASRAFYKGIDKNGFSWLNSMIVPSNIKEKIQVAFPEAFFFVEIAWVEDVSFKLYFMIPTRVIDALDHEKTVFARPFNNLQCPWKMVFRAELLHDVGAFLLPPDRYYFQTTIVSERMAHFLKRLSLDFRFWDSMANELAKF